MRELSGYESTPRLGSSSHYGPSLASQLSLKPSSWWSDLPGAMPPMPPGPALLGAQLKEVDRHQKREDWTCAETSNFLEVFCLMSTEDISRLFETRRSDGHPFLGCRNSHASAVSETRPRL